MFVHAPLRFFFLEFELFISQTSTAYQDTVPIVRILLWGEVLILAPFVCQDVKVMLQRHDYETCLKMNANVSALCVNIKLFATLK